MKIISLNGLWKCKPDLDNIGIRESWFDSKNYNEHYESLIGLKIPTGNNILNIYENFEGFFWYFHKFDVDLSYINEKYYIKIRFRVSNYNTKIWLNIVFSLSFLIFTRLIDIFLIYFIEKTNYLNR